MLTHIKNFSTGARIFSNMETMLGISFSITLDLQTYRSSCNESLQSLLKPSAILSALPR